MNNLKYPEPNKNMLQANKIYIFAITVDKFANLRWKNKKLGFEKRYMNYSGRTLNFVTPIITTHGLSKIANIHFSEQIYDNFFLHIYFIFAHN